MTNKEAIADLETLLAYIPIYQRFYQSISMGIKALKQESKTGHCKDCKWWKDSDGAYRRGIRAESKCPMNTLVVQEGEGYCYMFEPNESDHKCHTCKHYTSGELDGSCGSYICKHYSNWESEEI